MATQVTKKVSIALINDNPLSHQVGLWTANSWNELKEAVNNTLSELIKNSGLRPKFEMVLERKITAHLRPGSPLHDFLPDSDRLAYRIVVAGDSHQLLLALPPIARAERACLPPITFVVVHGENPPIFLHPPPGIALSIQCPWKKEVLFRVLHHLAVEIYACVYFLGPYSGADNHRKCSAWERLSQLKVQFAREQLLEINEWANQVAPGTGYFPFAFAVSDHKLNEPAHHYGLDIPHYAKVWRSFQRYFVENPQVHGEQVYLVQNVDEIIARIQTEHAFNKIRGFLSLQSIRGEAENCIKHFGMGDYALLVAAKAPKQRSKIVNVVNHFGLSSDHEWRSGRSHFERYREFGYRSIRPYVSRERVAEFGLLADRRCKFVLQRGHLGRLLLPERNDGVESSVFGSEPVVREGGEDLFAGLLVTREIFPLLLGGRAHLDFGGELSVIGNLQFPPPASRFVVAVFRSQRVRSRLEQTGFQTIGDEGKNIALAHPFPSGIEASPDGGVFFAGRQSGEFRHDGLLGHERAGRDRRRIQQRVRRILHAINHALPGNRDSGGRRSLTLCARLLDVVGNFVVATREEKNCQKQRRAGGKRRKNSWEAHDFESSPIRVERVNVRRHEIT
jgi:hypothetical protein